MRYAVVLLTLAISIQLHAKSLVVAVVDTGYDVNATPAPLCHDAAPMPDNIYKHGTNVVGLIAQEAGTSGYCVYPFSVFDGSYFNSKRYHQILSMLTHMHVDVLNLSLEGHVYDQEEVDSLKQLLDQGVTIFSAAGNHRQALYKDHCITYPACDDPRITVVGTYESTSGKGPRIDIQTHKSEGCAGGVCLTGTSQATAIETGRFIRYLLLHK